MTQEKKMYATGEWTNTLPATDCREERCIDCDCGNEHEVKNLVPGFDVRIHKKVMIDGTGHADIDDFIRECLETMRIKGHDYRQGNDDDLLHNFRTVSETVGEDITKVWFTYFYKHYSALATYIKEGGQSESEPIEGRIKDMIVYLLLFYRMLNEDGRFTE